MRDIANDNAAVEYRGRSDLLELATASNARIVELHRQIVTLNAMQPNGADEAEYHRRHIRSALAKVAAEGRRFDAIEAAMDEATLIRFWGQVGIPARA